MLFRNHADKFHHTYIYVDERKEKLEEIKRNAIEEITEREKGYRADKIKGFLTDKKHRQIISTTTALLLILIFAIIWYILIY